MHVMLSYLLWVHTVCMYQIRLWSQPLNFYTCGIVYLMLNRSVQVTQLSSWESDVNLMKYGIIFLMCETDHEPCTEFKVQQQMKAPQVLILRCSEPMNTYTHTIDLNLILGWYNQTNWLLLHACNCRSEMMDRMQHSSTYNYIHFYTARAAQSHSGLCTSRAATCDVYCYHANLTLRRCRLDKCPVVAFFPGILSKCSKANTLCTCSILCNIKTQTVVTRVLKPRMQQSCCCLVVLRSSYIQNTAKPQGLANMYTKSLQLLLVRTLNLSCTLMTFMYK